MKTDSLEMSSKTRAKRKVDFAPYYFISPAVLVIIIALIVPIFIAIYLSMTNADLITFRNAKFIGMGNYIKFFTSMSLGKVFYATFVYVILGVFFTYCVGLAVATILNQELKFKALFRAIFILPWVIPQVVLVLIWKWMLNPQYGVINYILSSIRLLPLNFSWFSNVNFAIIAILLVTIWKQYPLACLILLAGMKTIPNELYEAARIDGANRIKSFFHITMPGLKYVTSVLVMLLTIWSFTNFVIIWLMTQGGPADRTATFTVFTYLNAFKFNKLGYGAAIGVISLLISLTFSFFYYRVFIKNNE